jgi:predicted small secreted protein
MTEAVMKRYALVAVAALVVAASGCNTMEGLGKDIQKAGEAIERKAK